MAKRQKRKILFRFMRVILAVGIALFLVQVRFDFIESFFYDLRVRISPSPNVTGQIVTLAIDNKTEEHLGGYPKALDHVVLFERLAEAEPMAVVYLQNMEEDIIGSYEDLEVLAEVSEKINFFAVDDTRLPEPGMEEYFRLLPPLQDLRLRSAPITADISTFAKDGVSRRMILSFKNESLLHLELASELNKISDASQYRGSFVHKRTEQAYINFHKPGSFSRVSFVDIMDGNFNDSDLRGKIILIGRDTRANINDYVTTPFSRDSTAMSRLELHANIFETLIQNSAPIRSPWWLDFLATALISILTIFVVMAVRPAKGLTILIITIAFYFTFCTFFFATGGLWLDMTHPLLSIFICYYFFIPYRLIVENRKSWEYYQKHALLSQVEEMKSNFMRLMSHDLKTPVARIQGMVELINRDPNPMSPAQEKAVDSIGKSADELTSFFGSVLSLGRIESKDVKLQLKSRDVNALLKEVVAKCEDLAMQKNIKIITEFEPMFSMKIDEDLMRQVFVNLVENAIKYSPEGSNILVSTEEVNGKVAVQVADQGIGIPQDEIPSLFSKFYRAEAARDSKVKGSGLGLYLSNYFVQLHQGQISVESEPQEGSTFTVELPMGL